MRKQRKRSIWTPLHNINRQNVKANKFFLGRLGEKQPNLGKYVTLAL